MYYLEIVSLSLAKSYELQSQSAPTNSKQTFQANKQELQLNKVNVTTKDLKVLNIASDSDPVDSPTNKNKSKTKTKDKPIADNDNNTGITSNIPEFESYDMDNFDVPVPDYLQFSESDTTELDLSDKAIKSNVKAIAKLVGSGRTVPKSQYSNSTLLAYMKQIERKIAKHRKNVAMLQSVINNRNRVASPSVSLSSSASDNIASNANKKRRNWRGSSKNLHNYHSLHANSTNFNHSKSRLQAARLSSKSDINSSNHRSNFMTSNANFSTQSNSNQSNQNIQSQQTQKVGSYKSSLVAYVRGKALGKQDTELEKEKLVPSRQFCQNYKTLCWAAQNAEKNFVDDDCPPDTLCRKYIKKILQKTQQSILDDETIKTLATNKEPNYKFLIGEASLAKDKKKIKKGSKRNKKAHKETDESSEE